MIYIVDYDLKYDLISKILDILNIEYTKLESSDYEIEEIIRSKNFEGIFLNVAYSEVIKKLYPKEFKKLSLIDFIVNNSNELEFYNTLYEGFKIFLGNQNLSLDNKSVLLLGETKTAKVVYNVIKDISNATVYISSITEENDSKLYAGDRKIKKIEIANLQKTDYIINATELGNINSIDSCMLEGRGFIKSDNIIDLLSIPKKTFLLRKYSKDGAKIYSGLLILIYQVLFSISVIKKEKMNLDKVFEIYEKFKDNGEVINSELQ